MKLANSARSAESNKEIPSLYDHMFEQQLIDHGIHPAGHSKTNSKNWNKILGMVEQPGQSPFPPGYDGVEFENSGGQWCSIQPATVPILIWGMPSLRSTPSSGCDAGTRYSTQRQEQVDGFVDYGVWLFSWV